MSEDSNKTNEPLPSWLAWALRPTYLAALSILLSVIVATTYVATKTHHAVDQLPLRAKQLISADALSTERNEVVGEFQIAVTDPISFLGDGLIEVRYRPTCAIHPSRIFRWDIEIELISVLQSEVVTPQSRAIKRSDIAAAWHPCPTTSEFVGVAWIYRPEQEGQRLLEVRFLNLRDERNFHSLQWQLTNIRNDPSRVRLTNDYLYVPVTAVRYTYFGVPVGAYDILSDGLKALGFLITIPSATALTWLAARFFRKRRKPKLS